MDLQMFLNRWKNCNPPDKRQEPSLTPHDLVELKFCQGAPNRLNEIEHGQIGPGRKRRVVVVTKGPARRLC